VRITFDALKLMKKVGNNGDGIVVEIEIYELR